MDADGKLCIAVTLIADGDIRWICVYYTSTKEEAEQLTKDDPAVKIGRLIVKYRTW